jgi:predicted TIM-barrel fold metal-dependent hydrolase
LKGAIIWQAPHPDLPFRSSHYDKFWAAAEDLGAPVSLHILTGHSYNKDKNRKGVERYRGSVNLKLMDIANALFELIFYGVLERHPKLKIVSVENEVGWMPFMFQQWDYYYNRFRGSNPPPITRNPSNFVKDQIYSCFFNDHVCGQNLKYWGQDTVMWSNDFPHPNSTWPNSKKIIQRDLGHLPPEIQAKVLYQNVCRLYGIEAARLPQIMSRISEPAQASA